MFLFVARAEAQNCSFVPLLNDNVLIKMKPSNAGRSATPPRILLDSNNDFILLNEANGTPQKYPAGDRAQLESFFCPGGLHPFLSPMSLSLAPAALTTRKFAPMAAAAQPAAGQTPSGTVVADFNGDGYPDVATLSSSGVTVTLYNADGTALAQHFYPVTGSLEPSLVTADFNGDGKADLAFPVAQADGSTGSVAILLGNGDGTFRNIATYSPEIYPTALAMGDFNGDGIPDLAVAGAKIFNGLEEYALSLLIGKGDGTFAAALVFTPFANVQSMVTADVNGDGKTDLLATATLGSTVGDGGLVTYLGNGDGTFHTALYTQLPVNLPFLAYADLNHDGNLDAVLAEPDQASLYVLFGNGNGTFQAPVVYAAPANADTVGLAPLGDGNTAIFMADQIDGTTVLAFADNSGTVEMPAVQDAGPPYRSTAGAPPVVTADLNGDGKPDLLITEPTGLLVNLNGGDGTFAAAATYPVDSGAVMSAVADVFGNRHQDILFTNQTGVGLLVNQGSGTFVAGPSVPLGSSSAIAVADFNGDGRPDFAAIAAGQSGGATIAIMLGNGDGTFSPAETITPAFAAGGLAAGDFNNDGKADLVAGYSVSSDSQIVAAFYPGKGNGFFGTPVPLPVEGQIMAAADLNGDGKLDIVLYNSHTNELSVLPGDGDGTFAPPVFSLPEAGISSVAIADVNGDGKPDLVVGVCCGLVEPSVLLGNGDGTFQAPQYFIAGTANPGSVAAANFSGSGMGLAAVGDYGYSAPTAIISVFYSASAALKVQSSANPNPGIGIAPGSLASAYGTDLALLAPASQPLPTNEAPTTVAITDSTGATTDAQLLYISTGQVNFLVPSGIANGPATVTVTSADGHISIASTEIAAVAPGVFELNGAGLVAADVVLYSGSAQTPETVYATSGSTVVASPVSLGQPGDQAYLEIFGTGLQAAGKTGVVVTIGGLNAPVHYVGPQGQYIGLDQVNVQIPPALAGKGRVTIQVTANGIAANPVNMTIQ